MSLIPMPYEIIAAEAFIRAGGGVAILADDEAGQRVMRWLAEHCDADPDDWDWVGIARADSVDADELPNVVFVREASSLWRLRCGVLGYPIPSTSLVAVVSYHG